MKPTVVHAVATDNFAGVEQYICYVAPRLASLGWHVVVAGGDPGPMRSALAVGDVEYHAASSVLNLARVLMKTAPDIVHAHMTAAELAAVMTRPWTRCPLVTTRHFAAPRGSSAAARGVGRIIAKFESAQLSISQFVANSIEDESVVLANGVPNQLLGAHDQRIVLVAQRFEKEKETEFALRAFAASHLSEEGWVLHLAGRGVEQEDLSRTTIELGIDSSVAFLGFVDDLPERMSRCGIFLATAPAEPFGLSVAEAMACGSPVLAVDGGAHPELIGRQDALLQRGDVSNAARRLRSVALDPAYREQLGSEMRARQQESFAIDHHVQRLDSSYRSGIQKW